MINVFQTYFYFTAQTIYEYNTNQNGEKKIKMYT